MILVQIWGVEAGIDELQWVVPTEPRVEKFLNSLIDPLGPSGADPYPDLTVAREVVDRFGGAITYQDPVPDIDENKIY